MGYGQGAGRSACRYLVHQGEQYADAVSLLPEGEHEAVHDARTALRRLRSVRKGFGVVLGPLPPGEKAAVAETFSALAELREVQLRAVTLSRTETIPEPSAASLADELRRASEAAVRRLDMVLNADSSRVERSFTPDRRGSVRSKGKTFSACLRRQWQGCEERRIHAVLLPSGQVEESPRSRGQAVEKARPATRSSPETALHELRKSLKALRYMAEALESWAGDVLTPLVADCEARQEILGRLNDGRQFGAWLREASRHAGVDESAVAQALSAVDEQNKALEEACLCAISRPLVQLPPLPD